MPFGTLVKARCPLYQDLSETSFRKNYTCTADGAPEGHRLGFSYGLAVPVEGFLAEGVGWSVAAF